MPPLRVLIRAGSPREAANYRELLDGGDFAAVGEGAEADVVLLVLQGAGPAIPVGGPPILLLTGEEDPGTHPLPERAGVSVLSDAVSRRQLRAALSAVAAGLTVGTSSAVAAPLRGQVADTDELTPRERELLRFLGEGYGNREIARALGLSDHTVKFHLRSIYAKLGARTRTEAVSLAVRRGLLML